MSLNDFKLNPSYYDLLKGNTCYLFLIPVFVIEKLLKSEESIQEYLGIFEELCKEAATKINNDRFKVKG